MWNKWKESDFFRRLRERGVARAVWVSGLIIVLTLAIVLGITAIANRAGRKHADEPDSTSTTAAPADDRPSGSIINTDPNEENKNLLPTFSLPVTGKLTADYSADIQVFSKTMQDYRVHLGIDIATADGACVYAAAKGTVCEIREDPLLGCCVTIAHSGDCKTTYGNLNSELPDDIRVGASVAEGQFIGNVGDSALCELAEEPHLHLEMRIKDQTVDPLEYFSASVRTALTKDTAFEESVGNK